MSRPAGIQQVLRSAQLPSLPAVALEVLELSRDVNVPLHALARAMEKDQGLATKILRTINSSYYGLKEPCGTITRAIGYLGLNTVRTIALSFSLVDTVDGGKDETDISFNFVDYWRRAIYGAAAARLIASRVRGCDPEEAFLAGLMEDIGMIAAYRVMDEQYLMSIDVSGDDHRKLCGIEQRSFEFDHAELGAAMAEQWRLPERIIRGIAHHHESSKAPQEFRGFSQVVEAATLAAMCLSESSPPDVLDGFFEIMKNAFDIPEILSRAILEEVADQAAELARLLNVNAGDRATLDQIRTSAQDLLLQQQMDLDRQFESVHDFAVEHHPTGRIFDRASFETELSSEFNESASRKRSLTVLFVGPVGVERANQTAGHDAGDTLVQKLTSAVLTAIDGRGMLARYVACEFAVLLPNFERTDVPALCERIRQAVDAVPNSVRPAWNVGSATFDAQTADRFRRWPELVHGAALALYAARKRGPNSFQVYRSAVNETGIRAA